MARPARALERRWPATLGLLAVALTAAYAPACAAVGDDDSMSEGPPDPASCPSEPTAYVFEANAEGAREALARAGFAVESLPRDTSPASLRGLIVLPSFASADPAYTAYMASYAKDLRSFVARGNVLLQLAQPRALEPAPPFLPPTRRVRRSELDVQAARVVHADNPLLEEVEVEGGMLEWTGPDVGLDAFSAYAGYEVILSDDTGTYPLLLEGAIGYGRVLLSSVVIDRARAEGEQEDFAEAFFANAHAHVSAVCAGRAEALQLESVGRSAFVPGSSILAVLPDTQYYWDGNQALLNAEISFIRNNVKRLDIQFLVNLGDIVDLNTPDQWQMARAAFSMLDGVLPYAIVPGNHDYGPLGSASTRDTLLNDYFPYEVLSAFPTFGGAYEEGRLDNTYHLFSIGGRDFILLALEWGPRDEVVAWADQVMLDHPDRDGILVTHAYLNYDNRRYDYTDTKHPQEYNPHDYDTAGGVNDGEQLWQKLVRRHRFLMTLNGHVLGDGAGYLASVTDKGNVCHQMLSNYQFRTGGGEAYFRLLEFLPDGKTVNVFTYSPYHDALLDEPDQNFTIELD